MIPCFLFFVFHFFLFFSFFFLGRSRGVIRINEGRGGEFADEQNQTRKVGEVGVKK